MPNRPSTLRLTEEQVLYFRARRGHLAGPGAPDVETAARDMLGAQAQQIAPSLLALSQRTAGRPTAAKIHAQMADAPRTLVRTWGQRGTLHLYHASADWNDVNLVRDRLSPGGRLGAMPPTATVNKVRKLLDATDEAWTRANLEGLIPPKYMKVVKEHLITHRMPPEQTFRFAAGRILWRIAMNGDACLGHKVGAEQTYLSRRQWFPHLNRPQNQTGKQAEQQIFSVGVSMTRRYLSLYGPGTPHDVAHFLGAKVSEARTWIARLEQDGELLQVECNDRPRLLALAADADELQNAAPKSVREWPVRLLPLWDSMMMGHADKSWTVPLDADRKRIWRAGAYVAATIFDRGRVVGIWKHKVQGKKFHAEIEPLSGWKKSRHEAAVKRELKAVATHLNLSSIIIS
jgi:hypothetical protein